MTNKTHTDAREMMKLCYLEPDCVISTFEFIVSSFRFVSNQLEYIRTIRLESRVELRFSCTERGLFRRASAITHDFLGAQYKI